MRQTQFLADRSVWPGNEAHQSVAHLTFDAESLSHIVFPADVIGSSAPEFFPFDLDFVIVSPSGQELKRVPIQFERRLLAANVVDMWGFDSTKTFETHVRAQRDGTWMLNIRTAPQQVYASQAQFIVQLLELLQPPNGVALTLRGSPPDAARSVATTVMPAPPEGLVAYIRALASLEAYVGKPILVPDSETDEQSLHELDVAQQLLAGDRVLAQWDQAEAQMPVAAALDLLRMAKNEGPLAVEMTRSWTVHVGKEHQYMISPVTILYRSVRVVESPTNLDRLPDDASVTIRLVPADEERGIELYLRSPFRPNPVPEAVFNDDSVTWVPPAFFDELLESLDAPDETLPELAHAFARLRDIHRPQ